MTFGRFGGMLVIGGCALLPLVVAIGGSGPVGVDGHPNRDVGNVVMNASLALLGSGAAVLSLAGARPLHGRSVRIGLGLLAVGLLSLVASSMIPFPAGSNSAESWPYIITGTVFLLATAVGTPVTVASLVRMPGPTRVAGSLLLAGLLYPSASILSLSWTDQPFGLISGALQLIGYVGLLGGLSGIGVLAIRGDRSGSTEAG